MVPPPGVTPFVVLSMARSGSTLFVHELGRRWPEIRSLGEEFNALDTPRCSVDDGIRHVFLAGTPHRFVGCKIFRGHLPDADLMRVLALPGMRVVILRRRNTLRQYLSQCIAQTEQVWAIPRTGLRAPVEARRVEIDPTRYLEHHLMSLRSFDDFEGLAKGLPVLRVDYEDFAADLDATLRRVASFLGAGPPRVEPPSMLVRQNPEPIDVLVSNYPELRSALVDARMTEFLEEGAAADVTPARSGGRPGWPDPVQEVVLHLALDPPGREGEWIARWLDSGQVWSPDDGVRRLAPLVHRRVTAAGIDLSQHLPTRTLSAKARGRNLQLLHALGEVLDRLAAAGVRTLVLKGAALALLHYGHLGDRPMHDLDVMVPPDQVAIALDGLRADGWTFLVLPADTPIERLLTVRHSVALVRDDIELDLHWHSLVESVGTSLDDDLWATSVPLDVLGRSTRALCPADQVLHVAVHGLRWNPVPTIRWVADAHTVITSAGPDLDWRRLADLARRHRLGAPVTAAVGYLATEFPGIVAPEDRAVVAAVPVSRRDRRVFEHGLRPHGPTGTALSAWYRYRRRVPHRTGVGALPGFFHDMMRQLDLDRATQVPGRLAREVALRRRRSRTGA